MAPIHTRRELAAQRAVPLNPAELRRRELAHEVLPHLRDFHAGYLEGEERVPLHARNSGV